MTALRAYVGSTILVALVAVWVVVAGDSGLVLSTPVLVLAAAGTIAQWFPVRIVRRDGNQDIEASHAFLLAILLIAGPVTAVAVQVVAAVAVNVAYRRPPIKALFNVSQMTVATAAAGGVLSALTQTPALATGNGFSWDETAAFLLAAGVYQLINELAVVVACALADGRPVLLFLGQELRLSFYQASVSAMAPLAAVGVLAAPWLVPIMVAPLWAVHRAASLNVEVVRQSRCDALTGLPNALALREALAEALARRPATVAMLDLDGFKDINDTLGHQAGDTLLRAVADRLAAESDGRARVFRLQGDEFLALLDDDPVEDALLYASDLQQAFGRPFRAGELELDIGVSAGVTRVERGGCSVDELLRRADVAMYEAKRNRLGFALYRPASDTGERARQVISADLRRALDAGEVEVHYQPQCSLSNGAIESVEALVRWRLADGTVIPPADFIPQAERTRVMMPLTVHVLRTAVADCRRWSDAHGYTGRVAINVSARTLHHPSLVADVRTALEQSGLRGDRLEIEITESALMVDPEGARRTLAALHGLGVAILIDDFGTGYSSMAYLSTLPVDGVKVDRSFVSGMVTEHADLVIVRSTIDLGQSLGLRTIAEGVEDPATRDALITLGCELAQGWLWYPALPATAIGEVLTAPVKGRVAA